MMYHYEWDNTEEDSAIVTHSLMELLFKLKVGYKYLHVSQSHVCDTTITVEFKT